MNFGQVSANSFLAVCFCARLLNQEPQEVRLDTIEKLELQNLKADIVSYLGRAAVHIENTGPRDSGYADAIARIRWDCVSCEGSFAFRVLLHLAQEWTIGRSVAEEPFGPIHLD